MHPHLYLTPLAIGVALTIFTSAKAAEPFVLQQQTMQNLQQQFELQFPGLKKLQGNNPNSLQYLKEHTDLNKTRHIRMEQYYKGFLVYGGYAILHTRLKNLLGSQDIIPMNGSLYKGLQQELGSVPPAFVKNGPQALEKFKQQYKGELISEEQVRPIIFIDNQHQAHWAYRVSVYISYKDKIPARPTAIVDANTYSPFVQWNDLKTSFSLVKGRGFGGNPKTGEYSYGKNHPFLELTRDNEKGICFMENIAVRIVDMQHKLSSNNKPMQFTCNRANGEETASYWTGYKGDGYDKQNGAFSPSNDALFSGYVIKHLYHDWYGVEVLSRKNVPMQLVMRVHYGNGYENAYWDGRQMTFGDGDYFMYPLVSLGISAHEISHGFTEQHANLEYYDESGGINESFSDMAAQVAEFYSIGKSSWQIGAEVMKEDQALRYMDLPSRDGHSIDSANQFYKGLDVHFSSGVFNRLFYSLSTSPGWNPRKAFAVMIKANMDYWVPTSSFTDAGCGLLHAAADLNYSLQAIKKSLTAVAVNFSTCLA